MIKKYKFDYDYENDDLFLYNPTKKSKGSVEFDNLIIDYNSAFEITAIEIMEASKFFKDISDIRITKKLLKEITDCRVEFKKKGSFTLIKFQLTFTNHESLMTPMIVPAINDSPAIVDEQV